MSQSEKKEIKARTYDDFVREVAETIIKYQGLDSWELFTMSDRIKEKYGFEINS